MLGVYESFSIDFCVRASERAAESLYEYNLTWLAITVCILLVSAPNNFVQLLPRWQCSYSDWKSNRTNMCYAQEFRLKITTSAAAVDNTNYHAIYSALWTNERVLNAWNFAIETFSLSLEMSCSLQNTQFSTQIECNFAHGNCGDNVLVFYWLGVCVFALRIKWRNVPKTNRIHIYLKLNTN